MILPISYRKQKTNKKTKYYEEDHYYFLDCYGVINNQHSGCDLGK